jgi:choline dehydrogenase-like flavoprotein
MAVTSEISPEEAVSKAYNYVIIGGGTAGLAIAARLTEDEPSVHVLVLEAGKSRLEVSLKKSHWGYSLLNPCRTPKSIFPHS